MKNFNEIRETLEGRKDRSAWDRGVTGYAFDLLDEFEEWTEYAAENGEDAPALNISKNSAKTHKLRQNSGRSEQPRPEHKKSLEVLKIMEQNEICIAFNWSGSTCLKLTTQKQIDDLTQHAAGWQLFAVDRKAFNSLYKTARGAVRNPIEWAFNRLHLDHKTRAI